MTDVWSPSTTLRWLTCPRKWELERQGQQGVGRRWSPGRIVGTALHAGWCAWMRGEGDYPQVMESTLQEGWEREQPDTELTLFVVHGHAHRALRRVVAEQGGVLLGDHGVFVGCEVVLGPGDKEVRRYPGTADLITEHGTPDDRYLVITDWKTHWDLGDTWVDKQLTRQEDWWQLTQYAYFAQELYNKPVRMVRKVTARCLPSPRSWMTAEMVSTDVLTRWHKEATVVWQAMSAGQTYQNWTSCGDYGGCEYRHVCHS